MVRPKKIEVCISNLDLGSEFVWNQVANTHPDIRLIRWGCLGLCHRCVHVPFVLLDDSESLEAANPDDLWEHVKLRLSHPS